jgi:sulfite exporter TauE/SafE
MPCGLVYAALALAATAGSAAAGAATMAAFGAGTFPTLFALGALARRAMAHSATSERAVRLRLAAAAVLLVSGALHAGRVGVAWADSSGTREPPCCHPHAH